MNRLLLLLLAFALPATGQITFTTPSKDACTVTCTAGTVTPPPIFTPPPAPPPTGSFPYSPIPAPAVGGVAQLKSYDAGVTYAFPIPATRSGLGTVAISAEGGVGTQAHLEISFTKVPGDWTTAKTTAVIQKMPWGTFTTFPYYGEQGGYVSLVWGVAAAIPAGEQWYCNLRSSLTGYLTVQIPQQ